MKLSAGIILTDGKKFLVGKANRLMWDIPKGGIEEGESPMDAMVRELWEESNIKFSDLSNGKLTDLGVLPYTKSKRLHLFIYNTQELPSLSSMKCNSFHELPEGKKVPEMLEYKYIDFSIMSGYLVPSMVKVITDYVIQKL